MTKIGKEYFDEFGLPQQGTVYAGRLYRIDINWRHSH